jgi:hypothetical protein
MRTTHVDFRCNDRFGTVLFEEFLNLTTHLWIVLHVGPYPPLKNRFDSVSLDD